MFVSLQGCNKVHISISNDNACFYSLWSFDGILWAAWEYFSSFIEKRAHIAANNSLCIFLSLGLICSWEAEFLLIHAPKVQVSLYALLGIHSRMWGLNGLLDNLTTPTHSQTLHFCNKDASLIINSSSYIICWDIYVKCNIVSLHEGEFWILKLVGWFLKLEDASGVEVCMLDSSLDWINIG